MSESISRTRPAINDVLSLLLILYTLVFQKTSAVNVLVYLIPYILQTSVAVSIKPLLNLHS